MRKLTSKLQIACYAVCLAALFTGCSKNTDSTKITTESEFPGAKASAAFAVAGADGFATGTTGGAGGSAITVTTAADFRSAAESSAKQIITVNGNLDMGTNPVAINSNKTIIGASQNATVRGNLQISGKTNVIVQNLNITNPAAVGTGDGIEISGSTKVFVTKCSIFDCADGNLDVVRASDNVTVSWCKFYYIDRSAHLFSNLIGNGDEATGDRGKLHVTLHHNWYAEGVNQRMPRVRFGYVHCYNNYFGSDNDYYCVGVGNESHILVENNCFENQGNPWIDSRSSTSVAYQLTWTGNVFINSPVPTWAVNTTTPFSRPYTYSLHTGSAIKTVVTLGAGNK